MITFLSKKRTTFYFISCLVESSLVRLRICSIPAVIEPKNQKHLCNLTSFQSPRKRCFQLNAKMNQRTHHNMILKVLWAYFHLGPLDRVPYTFPLVPVHSSAIDLAGHVQTIQVRRLAIPLPPGAFNMVHGTVMEPLVIIAILGAKWHPTVIIQSISSGACRHKK